MLKSKIKISDPTLVNNWKVQPYQNLLSSVFKIMQRIWYFQKWQFLELGFHHETNHKFTLLAVNMTWNPTITRLTCTNSLVPFNPTQSRILHVMMGVILNFRSKSSMSLLENFLNDENQQEE